MSRDAIQIADASSHLMFGPSRQGRAETSLATVVLSSLLLFSQSGCVQRDLSNPVRAVHDVRCPAAKIRVLEHLRVNGEELWVLDACGVLLELEEGIELPTQWRELVSDPDEIPALQSRLQRPALDIDEAAREKAEAWCKLRAPSDPSAISFNSTTEAELGECRRRMRTIRTLGMETDPSGEQTYWFSLGQWLFMAPVSFHRPACSRLQVTTPPDCYCPDGESASSACARAERARHARAAELELRPRTTAVEREGKNAAKAEPSPRSWHYVRGGAGVGFISSTGGDMAAQTSGTFSSHIGLGVLLTPALAIGGSVLSHRALVDYHGTLAGSSVDIPMSQGSLQAFASYYFLAGPAFFHVDAFGGTTRLSRVYIPPSWSFGDRSTIDSDGASFGVGAGLESYGSGLMIGLRVSAVQSWTSRADAEFSTIATALTLDLGYY